MKRKERNTFVAGAFSLIIAFILTAFFIGGGANNKLILQPDTNQVINQTQSSIEGILSDASGTIQGENNAPKLIDVLFTTQKNNTLTLYGFSENEVISTPLVFAGKIPSNWVSEGKIGVKLLTESGTLLAEGYGNSNVFDQYGEVIPGDVEFTVDMEVKMPPDLVLKKGKLQLTSANPNFEDSIDVAVFFE